MKKIRIIIITLFILIITTPLIFFNTTSDAISIIDNRKLVENPFSLQGDLTLNIQKYVNDRIGFRDEMITTYTVLNDKLFGKMVHPSYTYGKDGYVFGAGLTTSNNFGDFHIAFADMVAKIQQYCHERGVPFLFVFNPAKPAVYEDKIADGVNYNREWVDLFLAELDKREINYLDNTKTMKTLRENGIHGFNQKYDANHWNDLGAFYGTKAMLDRLNMLDSSVYVNKLEDFSVSETLQTSLLVSKFPIKEYVPALKSNTSTINLYEKYFPELQINKSYKSFGYYLNESDNRRDTPKTLIFQGSYMNGHGAKYMQNAFKEYIHVHDYQNVLDFPYYFNIFQPECVVFEVAEYTFSNGYFNYEKMKSIDYHPSLSVLEKDEYRYIETTNEDFIVNKGNTLTTIIWKTSHTYPYVWISLDKVYNMKKVDGGYQVTVEIEIYEKSKDSMKIISTFE